MSSSSGEADYSHYHSAPSFFIGQHDSTRWDALDDGQYGQLLSSGFTFATAPITNQHFHSRVCALYQSHLERLRSSASSSPPSSSSAAALPAPRVPMLTDDDTSLFPGRYITSMVACVSPWIDLYAADPLVADLSRQVLHLELAYASFCGVRNIILPGPRADASSKQLAQYARAVLEALQVAKQATLAIHMPMYREPGLEDAIATLAGPGVYPAPTPNDGDIDLYSSWDAWHTIRSVCSYSTRLAVALRIPKRLPEIELQSRWFAEPLHYLTFHASIFQPNASGFPSLGKYHQALINRYMRLKLPPWLIVSDGGPRADELAKTPDAANASGNASSKSNVASSQLSPEAAEFPTPAEAITTAASRKSQKHAARKPQSDRNAYLSYLKYLERSQEPYSGIETSTLTSFQDWLQSPLQPLADNLESATYEVFEGDPVKYNQYEKAITMAMLDWKALQRPTSALPRPSQEAKEAKDTQPELVVAVAGAGRGPLVTRVIRASAATGVPVQLWALEKNQNAYVYLLRMNKQAWGGRVHLVQTDMRAWPGPVAEGHEAAGTITKVDILVSELLGSFGDNELSPECIDGVQHHLARPHGISIPQSYTAHLSPVAYPRVYADLSARNHSGCGGASGGAGTAGAAGLGGFGEESVFETPWVVHLFAIDLVAQKVPGRPRFQQAWEFVHPTDVPGVDGTEPARALSVGAMHQATGRNEHNARHCHLTFVCRPRGVIHGLAGYFESVLYQPAAKGVEPVEISTRPDCIDAKSKDMISWFPIFFPLKKPIYFPQDAEIEVSMWRQTDDSRVWYEWLVEAFVWTGPSSRVKVAESELHSSHKVACLM